MRTGKGNCVRGGKTKNHKKLHLSSSQISKFIVEFLRFLQPSVYKSFHFGFQFHLQHQQKYTVKFMDWYFERDVIGLAVPENDLFNSLPSPDRWTSWGNQTGDFNTMEKLNVSGIDELLLNGTMFSDAVEQLSASRICQASRHTYSQCSGCPREYSDDELNDLPIIDEADDIFFDSLFKLDGRASEEAVYLGNCTLTSGKDDVMSSVDLSGEWNNFPDSIDDEFVGYFLSEKELKAEISESEEQTNVCVDSGDEYISKQERVLLDLQRLSVQLAKKTRTCLRDSLYRLAENSRHQAKCSWNGEDGLEKCEQNTKDGPSRFRKFKARNLETNAIDRTVATLLFDSKNSTSSLDAEALRREYEANSHPIHPSSSISSPCYRGGDAEVPTYGLMNRGFHQEVMHPSRPSTTFNTYA